MSDEEHPEVTVGVFLPASERFEPAVEADLDDDGLAPASGWRGRRAAIQGNPVAVVGRDVLRATAEAIGREVALVVGGVVAGIESPGLSAGSFLVDGLELTFGVKATLGAGKAVEAFLSASTEATVEVKLALKPRPGG
jgi:outer membrane receptor protein involved in Fe transport